MVASPPQRVGLRTWIGLGLFVLILYIIITNLGVILGVMWVVFGALLLNLAIRPLADRIARWHIPRGLAVLGVYLVLMALLALLGYLMVPVLSRELAQLENSAPALLQTALSRLSSSPFLRRFLPSSASLSQYLAQRTGGLLQSLVTAAASLGQLAVDLVIGLVLAYFFVSDAGIVKRLVERWLPSQHRANARALLSDVRYRLSHWIWAQLVLAAYLGVAYGVGMKVIGVPFGLTIGLVGGLLEIVPYVGGLAALVLAILSALTVRPILVVWVILYHTVLVEIEAHVLAPALFGRVTGLHPALLLIALLLGLKAGGIVGVFFAVPVTVVLLSVLDAARAVLVQSEPESERNEVSAE